MAMAVAAAPANLEQQEIDLDMLPDKIKTAVVKCIAKFKDGLDYLPMRYLSEDLLLARTIENLDRISDIPDKFQTDDFFRKLADRISLSSYYFPKQCKKIFTHLPTHIDATQLGLKIYRNLYRCTRYQPFHYRILLSNLPDHAKTNEFYQAIVQIDKTHVCFLPVKQQTAEAVKSALQTATCDIDWLNYLDKTVLQNAELANALRNYMVTFAKSLNGQIPELLYNEQFIKQLISSDRHWTTRIPAKYLTNSLRNYHYDTWGSDSSSDDSSYDDSDSY